MAATLLGLALNLPGFDSLRALDRAAIINGVAAAPVMALMLLATRRDVMGRFTLPPRLRVLGWLTAAAMLLAALGLFVTWGR
ncbi:hypothetical protein [Deinococcus aestuarii]|uniref:hypothetical protein n=1 Tax=Deinococcus aestuarii TaxID=2774531 RepID=UPI001C0A999F|nr:hypothetical protein [Deinococcus aestuarii]